MPTHHNNANEPESNPHENSSISPDAQTSVSGSPEAVNAGAATAAPADAANEQRSNANSAAAAVERNVADNRAGCQMLWRIIESYSAPNMLAKRWDFLGKHENWLRIDLPPGKFAAALAQKYTDETLIQLGLYERVGGKLRPPRWLDGDAPFYALLDEDTCTIKFSRGHESVVQTTRTALDYAVERVPPDWTRAPVTLFVGDSADSVEVLQLLGLRAVRADGLPALDGDDVQRLFNGDQHSDFARSYFLLLLDFDVAGLRNQPSNVLGKVIRRLADAAEVYEIDPAGQFGVYRPSAHEFRVLRRATTFHDATRICRLFENWSEAAQRVRINNWRTHFALKAAKFSVARTALTRALEQPDAFARQYDMRAALAAYRLAGKRILIQKFSVAIDRAVEGFDQLNLIAALGYAEKFLDADPLVRAAEAVLAGRTPPSTPELQAESFELQRQCMRELRQIQRDRKSRH